MHDFESGQREWLACQFEDLTTTLVSLTPSQWAEQKRYLPPQLTNLPGYYRFEVTPYLREIIDCLSVDSPIREVSLMKGAQIGATVGVLENYLGYLIDFVKTAPVMLVTADAEMAKQRLESNIVPMLQLSKLDHLIRSSDESNARKTGRTDKKLEWEGGGYALPFGAQNANKLRMWSIQALLNDEVDGWPDVVGKEGDPMAIVRRRTAGYENSRKIFDTSTPLIRGTSKIAERFALGDQRYYYVCCLSCGFAQVLRWSHTDEHGVVSGIRWDLDNGILVPDSVRYLCQDCGHEHFNDDKTRLLSPDHGAEWRPTALPRSPFHRSYHLSALYSPVGMQTWEACVRLWLEAWDPEKNRERDVAKLQVFYNTILGEPFEIRGERVRFEAVSEHRRADYTFGQIPNAFASRHCGGPVLLLTCAVDVHKESLAVSVFGWCRGRRTFLVDYLRFEGEVEQLDDPGTWGELRKLIEQKEYVADDGKKYGIAFTLIDSGYLPDKVCEFCSGYDAGVAPLKGREAPPKNATIKEFSPFETKVGVRAFGITVDLYKERWSAALRRSWDGVGAQPVGHFNAPIDIADKQLRELTAEVKREKRDARTGRLLGFEWHRPSGSANELWDTLIYANAALDILAWDVCRVQFGQEQVVWADFYDFVEQQRLYFRE